MAEGWVYEAHNEPFRQFPGMGVLRIIRIDVPEFLNKEGHFAVNGFLFNHLQRASLVSTSGITILLLLKEPKQQELQSLNC